MLLECGLAADVSTLGSTGGLLAAPQGRWHARNQEIDVASKVSSGDTFLGGFICALDSGKDWRAALGDSVATGTANVLSPGGGLLALEFFKKNTY
jgi:fructose-1-phosphate kinase PfkB-like protein